MTIIKSTSLSNKPVKKPKVLEGFSFDEKSYLDRSKINEIFVARCNVCNAEIKGSIKVASNFHKHVRTHAVAQISDNSEQSKLNFNAQTSIKEAKDSAEQITFEEALADLVGDCMFPLEFVESDGFRVYMSRVHKRLHPISRYKLRHNLIPKIYERNLVKLKLLVKEQTTINITMDLWSDKRLRGFIAFNGHYIDNHYIDKNWNSRCVLLEIKRFKGT